MRLRKKVGIDLKKRARDFKHLEREREREFFPVLMLLLLFIANYLLLLFFNLN